MTNFRNDFLLPLCLQNPKCASHTNDVIKCYKMMSSNVALLHSNNCCVVDLLKPAICEDLDLHIAIFESYSCMVDSVNHSNHYTRLLSVLV